MTPTCEVCGRSYIPAMKAPQPDGSIEIRATHSTRNRAARKCSGKRVVTWTEEKS